MLQYAILKSSQNLLTNIFNSNAIRNLLFFVLQNENESFYPVGEVIIHHFLLK